MKLKSAFMGCLSTAAIAGAVLASAAPGSTCSFRQMQGNSAFDLTTPQSPSVLEGKFLDAGKLGLIGASLAALAGLAAGGLLLKQRHDKQMEQALAADGNPTQPKFPGSSEFPIVVPPEALKPPIAAASEAEETKPELLSIR